ncbi:MAG: fatty acyl-AMP ligase, partial [Planctomycetota bacterium]
MKTLNPRSDTRLNSLSDRLEFWAEDRPETMLYTFRDVNGHVEDGYNFERFNLRVNFVAQRLADQRAVRNGEPVLLIYPPGLEGIVAFMACVKNGAIPVPAPWPDRISGRVAKERVHHIQADCGARTALSVADGMQQLNGNSNGSTHSLNWIATNQWRGTQESFESSHCDTLFLQYTSGSTGSPRGVIVTHENVIHNSELFLSDDDIGVSWLPFHHDMGLIGFYLFPICRGAPAHHISPGDFLKRPRVWFDTITSTHATITSAPNFGYQYCLRRNKIPDSELGDFDLKSVRLMLNGAEPVDPVTMEAFADRYRECGLPFESLVAIYGLAEHTLAVTGGGRNVLQPAAAGNSSGPVTQNHQTQSSLVSCGPPLPSVDLRIVDPMVKTEVPSGHVGEIWLDGKCVTDGYWGTNHPSECSLFRSTLCGENGSKTYLRTGDLGLLHDGELYITGRLKELILVRGCNVYPVDIESVVLRAVDRTDRREVAAFGVSSNGATEEIVVLIENSREPVDLTRVSKAIGEHLGVRPGVVALVPRGKLAVTSSGKLARNECRRKWDTGEIEPIEQVTYRPDSEGQSILEQLEGLPDDEKVESAGLDSLTMTELQLELLRGAEEKGLAVDDYQYDMRIVNNLSLGELRALLPKLKDPSVEDGEIERVQDMARVRIGRIAATEWESMHDDGRLADDIRPDAATPADPGTAAVLLTGATGFVGSFLLRSLLDSTRQPIVTLVRAPHVAAGRARIFEALNRVKSRSNGAANGHDWGDEVSQRVQVICGDLAKPKLGMDRVEWEELAEKVGTVYHCGAEVDYIKSYDALRATNVFGCEEAIRFCASGMLKRLHLISTTFVAGWSSDAIMEEVECHPPEDALNFGYAQSKWVAERLAYAARDRGLPVKLFRPSLLTAATTGNFVQEDIVSRVFSYLIRHGLRPNCPNQLSLIPADIAAHNMIAVSRNDAATADTYHVTAGAYANMMDICEHIMQIYGY